MSDQLVVFWKVLQEPVKFEDAPMDAAPKSPSFQADIFASPSMPEVPNMSLRELNILEEWVSAGALVFALPMPSPLLLSVVLVEVVLVGDDGAWLPSSSVVLPKSNKFESAFVLLVFADSVPDAPVESEGAERVSTSGVDVSPSPPHLQIHGGHGGVL